jgi:hypothetical protein
MSKSSVPKINIELAADELIATITLAEDQLFRVKFIDPKMPGHQANPSHVRAAESALHKLKAAAGIAQPHRKPTPSHIQLRVTTKV